MSRFHFGALALLLAVLPGLNACGGDPSPGAAQEAQTVPAQLPEAPPPNPDGTPDPAIVQKLVDAGAEPDEAHWLALTTVATSNPEPGVAHIAMTYPWGDTTRIELRLSRIDASEVKPAEILEVSVQPGKLSGAIRYDVPAEDLPATTAALLPPGAKFNLLDVLVPPAHAQSGNYFNRVFQKWFTETASDEAQETALKALGGDKWGGRVSNALNVAKAGTELSELSDEKQKLVKEIDDLRKCTEKNPSGVQWVPGEKEKILKQIDELRDAIIADVHVVAANTVASTAAGMQPIKLLGVPASAIMAMTGAQIKQLIQDRMDDIRRSASKGCGKQYVIGDCPLSGTIPDVDSEFHARTSGYHFRFSGGMVGQWDWKIARGHGNGPYEITLAADKKRGKLRVGAGPNVLDGFKFTSSSWMCTLTAIED